MIGPLNSYQDVYVAECGEPFRSRREGQAHENTCHACQAQIYETDEARESITEKGLTDGKTG